MDVATVDTLVAAGTIPPPDVVKIDTEGAELVWPPPHPHLPSYRRAPVADTEGRP